jgi:GNAT superfamily N-acetyltransferase
MTPRLATSDDAASIARMHVQSWHETYHGLLPIAEIEGHTLASRETLWTSILEGNVGRASIIGGVGFALVKPQRDAALRDVFPDELFSLYVLKQAHGTDAGAALLTHVTAETQTGFTACVLKGNSRAIQFYRKSGGQLIKETIDSEGFTDLVFGWSVPIQLQS